MEAFVHFALLGIFFLAGWTFFSFFLLQNFESKDKVIQVLFCITFALSCSMFELIIFEIVDFLDRRLEKTRFNSCVGFG